MVNELIFNVLMALVVALIGIVAKTLLPYLKTKKDAAMAELRNSDFWWAADVIDAVVRAVEQTVSTEIHGEEKKAIAVKYITQLLSQAGIELSADQINTLLEAAVQEMNEGTVKINNIEGA